MYNAGATYRNLIDNGTRGSWGIKFFDMLNVEIDFDYSNVEFKHTLSDTMMWGNAKSQTVNITLNKETDVVLDKLKIVITLDAIEIPMGIFYVMEITEKAIKLNDCMIATFINYTSSIAYPNTLSGILTEINANYDGVDITIPSGFESIEIGEKLDATTVNDVLRKIAINEGLNVACDRLTGAIYFYTLNYTAYNVSRDLVYDEEVNKNDTMIDGVIATLQDGAEIVSGASLENAISYSPDYADQSRVDAYASLYANNYRGLEIKLIGDPTFDVGDIVTYDVDKTFIIHELTFKFDGGCSTEIKCKGATDQYSKYERSTPLSRKFLKVEKSIDDVKLSIGHVEDNISGQITTIEANANGLSSTVQQLTDNVEAQLNGNPEDVTDTGLYGRMSSVEQSSNELNITFGTFQSSTNELLDQTVADIDLIQQKISVSGEGVTLSNGDVEGWKLHLDNDDMTFIKGQNEACKMTPEGLYSDNKVEAGVMVKIGEYAWIQQENGHLSLLKVGI